MGEKEKMVTTYNDAVQTIKAAILHSQYKAVRIVNKEQLSLYYAIGRYVSFNSRDGYWGKGAIEAISRQLQKELPGLRGFSTANLKKMRLFYEAWQSLVTQSSMKTELQTPDITSTDNSEIENNMLLIINRSPLASDLCIEDFLSISFSHHMEILSKTTALEERIFYIRQVVYNRWNKYVLRAHLDADTYHHQGKMPSNFVQTIPNTTYSLRAIEMFKDEYLLDFINENTDNRSERAIGK